MRCLVDVPSARTEETRGGSLFFFFLRATLLVVIVSALVIVSYGAFALKATKRTSL